jgi:ATP-dependent Clp protease ATP-binding subunit ClpA/ATP-dependent Clp protease ATP-binding subunit ClpC
MELSVTIFVRRRTRQIEWFSIGLGELDVAYSGATPMKLRRRLTDRLRKATAKMLPNALEPLEFVPGRQLQTLTLELKLAGAAGRTRIRGVFPVIVEPRPRGPGVSGEPLPRVFHPLRPREWFVHEPSRDLAEEATAYFRDMWADLEGDDLEDLRAHAKDGLQLVRLTITGKPLASLLDKKEADASTLLGATPRVRGEELLGQLGSNETQLAVDDRLDPGIPRSPYREQLTQLIGGRRRQSVVLVGPSGVGKSTLLRRFVHDLLALDEYPIHRNLDRAHAVWRMSGRRLIAGMSYLGQWEQRCVDLLDACRKHRAVLWVEDIHAWGRIGETRESERSLATFFRGPVARGELVIVAECTAEQWQRLLLDAPALAGGLTTLFVEPTDEAETLRMLVHDARRLEMSHPVAFDATCLRTVYEMSRVVGGPGTHPGGALELLRTLAADDVNPGDLARAEAEARRGRKISAIKAYREVTGDALRTSKDMVEAFMASGRWPLRAPSGAPALAPVRSALARDFAVERGRRRIGPQEVVRALARRTGMPEVLLSRARRLEAQQVAESLSAQVVGQPAAVRAVVDLVVRLASGLTDRGRPYGVFLFTGPTGTGKTEMAKCLAEYLYGDPARLVRFDMSEYAGGDAASRLIGDRFAPRGQLTSRVAAQPFCVVLLDEIEKADASVLNLMLQLLDDGRLTDATGSAVDFTHTVIIMTSNLGAKAAPAVGFGESTAPTVADLDRAVKDFFPPELFNRIDRVVPFSALDDTAAHAIARRELSRLLARRGLAERDVFVRFTESVIAHIVAEGFAARDGARSLKRWLEDHVGAWLADEIATRGAAAMRVFWLYRRSGRLALHGQHLQEAPAPAEGSPLEPMLDWNARQLRDRLPAAKVEVDRMLDSEALAGIGGALRSLLSPAAEGDRAAGAEVHHLEMLRERLLALSDAIATQLEYDPLLAGAADEAQRATTEGEHREADDFAFVRRANKHHGEVHIRTLGRRYGSPSLPLASRPDFIDALAELYFLRLAVQQVQRADEHAVLLELTRLTRPGSTGRFEASGPGLLEWLALAYAGARGEVDAVVTVSDDGHFTPVPLVELEPALSRPHHGVVLRIVGPAVRTFFAAESGCHVRHGLAAGREIVRVRSYSGVECTPTEHVARQQEARRAFVDALESGAELPVDPDGVEPIVRRYDFDPVSAGRLSHLSVEDYPLAYAITTQARGIADVLPMLWLLAVGQAVARQEGS